MTEEIASQKQKTKLESLFDLARPRLEQLIADPRFVDRLLAVTLNSLARTPLLRQCDPGSVIRSVVQLAEMGLEPGGTLGDGYLVPYKNKNGGYDAQPIPGYRGLVRLALEEHLAVRVDAVIVRKGDFFDYDDSVLPPRVIHKPIPFSDESLVGVYCVISTAMVIPGAHGDGGLIQTQKVEVMSRKQVDVIRDRSRAKNGPWATDYEEMAKKTAFKRIAKWLGLKPSSKLGRAMELDDAADEDGAPGEQEREAIRSKAVTSFDEAAHRMADAAAKMPPKAAPPTAEIPPAPEEPDLFADPKVSEAGVDPRVQQAAAERTENQKRPDLPLDEGKKKAKRGAKAAKEAIDKALSSKCDGNHAMPECDDPQCWHRDADAPFTPKQRAAAAAETWKDPGPPESEDPGPKGDEL